MSPEPTNLIDLVSLSLFYIPIFMIMCVLGILGTSIVISKLTKKPLVDTKLLKIIDWIMNIKLKERIFGGITGEFTLLIRGYVLLILLCVICFGYATFTQNTQLLQNSTYIGMYAVGITIANIIVFSIMMAVWNSLKDKGDGYNKQHRN